MAVIFPRSVEDKLGQEAARDLVSWLEAFIKERTVGRDEFREVLSRLDRVEDRLERLETEFRQFRQEVNQRFETVNERFDAINARFDNLRAEMESRFDALNARMLSVMKWTVGTVLGIGSLLAILMSIYKFMG